jgi:transcriptional regulator with XRE-family HTH domain
MKLVTSQKRVKSVFSGKRLREQRDRRGLTQGQLAILIDGSQNQIKNYEVGKRVPNSDSLARIARALECSADYLLELSSDPGERMSGLSDVEQAMVDVMRSGVTLEQIQAMMTLFKGGKN